MSWGSSKKYKLYLFQKVNYENIENLILLSDDGFIDNKKVEFFEGLFKDCLKNN